MNDMKTNSEPMCYVAEDPQQPGSAWAVCADLPQCSEFLYREIWEWKDSGAIVRRVTKAEASEMLKKWVRHE